MQSSTLGVFKTKISASVILSVGGENELQKKLKGDNECNLMWNSGPVFSIRQLCWIATSGTPIPLHSAKGKEGEEKTGKQRRVK